MKSFNIWKKNSRGNPVFEYCFNQFYRTARGRRRNGRDSLPYSVWGFPPNWPSDPGSQLFDGGSLSLLADHGNRQMLSMVMQSKDGTLVVIDGGWDSDSAHLLDVIRSRGGHVSGWFITPSSFRSCRRPD